MPLTQMGVKRKLEEVENDGKCYGKQRQSILNISMCKLRTSPEKRVEPSLRRSVLILNTLKHIERELQQEGSPALASLNSTFTFPNVECNNFVLDTLPDSEPAEKLVSSELVSNTGGGKFQESTVTPDETTGGMICERPIDLMPVEKIEGTLDRSSSTTDCSVTVTTVSSQSSPQKMEDIFGDVDLARLDLDVFSSLASGMKLTPLSAEEVIHTFPGAGTDSYTLLNTQYSQYCRGDILEDLDSIMQILVGI